MNFKGFVDQTDYSSPSDLVGLAVYYLMVYGGEDTVNEAIAHDILSLYDFPMSQSAIAVKLNQLSDQDLLSWMDLENAPSGYILTPEGMNQIENMIPFEDTETDSYEPSVRIESNEQSDWDAFISHASEDKPGFVEPLAKRLEDFGLKVWYDNFELSVGDSIPEKIERGLASSDYGIVVLSEAFFNKDWTKEELNSLIQRDVSEPQKVILPVCYDIRPDTVREHHTMLGQRYLVQGTDSSVEEVAEKVFFEIIKSQGEPVDENGIDPFDEISIQHIAELIAQRWEGDDIKNLFEQINFTLDWDDAAEGSVQEYIATFPVEAIEKGLDLEKARVSAVEDKLTELNDRDPANIVTLLQKVAHPRTHIRNRTRRERLIRDLNEILQWEDLAISREGEVLRLIR